MRPFFETALRAIIKDETAKFLFDDRLLVRFKKDDGSGLGSNIETQAVLTFTDPQLVIPGLPDVQKVDVVYRLNDLQTKIQSVAVSARDNAVRLWSYEIDDRRGAPVLPLPETAPLPKSGNVVRVRFRASRPTTTKQD